MKKLLFIIMAILPLSCFAYADGWDTANGGGGTGDFSAADFADSLANYHAVVGADTFKTRVSHTYDMVKDYGVDTVGTSASDSLQIFKYADHTYSASVATTPPLGWASEYWRIKSIGDGAYKDSLSLVGTGIGGTDVPTTIDSLIVYCAVSDTSTDSTSVRVLVYKASSSTPILNKRIGTDEPTGWVNKTDQKWRRHAVAFTSDLVADEAYVVRFDIIVAGGAWVRISKARGK
jgi:hypothetical protein